MLSGLPPEVAMVYIDNILVPAPSFEKHVNNLTEVFKRLRQAKLKLSPEKCHLFQMKVKYLGHIISVAGISTDLDKVECIRSWPTPTKLTEGRGFLGDSEPCWSRRSHIQSHSALVTILPQLHTLPASVSRVKCPSGMGYPSMGVVVRAFFRSWKAASASADQTKAFPFCMSW